VNAADILVAALPLIAAWVAAQSSRPPACQAAERVIVSVMADLSLTLNGKTQALPGVEAEAPLLWVLREELGLNATKFGCGVAACGACTVHIAGRPMRSCVLPIGNVDGAVHTLEGLLADPLMQRLQVAWLQLQVPQCGYCQSGMLMAAHALLRQVAKPSDADIDASITNLCRCGTYPRIRAAIHQVAAA
jgi:isoquinoline 1-oxidoreductase alpha subunit